MSDIGNQRWMGPVRSWVQDASLLSLYEKCSHLPALSRWRSEKVSWQEIGSPLEIGYETDRSDGGTRHRCDLLRGLPHENANKSACIFNWGHCPRCHFAGSADSGASNIWSSLGAEFLGHTVATVRFQLRQHADAFLMPSQVTSSAARWHLQVQTHCLEVQ